MVLLLDAAHSAFIGKARERARRRSSLTSSLGATSCCADQLAGTNLAPSLDNVTPGQYYTVFKGEVFPREKQLEIESEDLKQGNTDSNGNPPCGNEVYPDVPYSAPALDFDLEDQHVDADFVRRYGQFFVEVVADMIEGPLPPAAQLVIATTVDPVTHDLRMYKQNVLTCPFCKGEVVSQSQLAAGNSAVKRKRDGKGGGAAPNLGFTRQVHVCRVCSSKWHRSEDRPDLFILHTRGKSSRMRKTAETQPKMVKVRKIGVHFLLQGVLVTQQTLLAILIATRKRSYAFDRRISTDTWDKAIDTGPAEKMMMRKVLHHKADNCRTCGGTRQTETLTGEMMPCVACRGSGKRIVDKIYRIFDVFYPHEGSFLTTLAAEQPAKYAALLEKHRSDIRFIVFLCSVAVPIKGAERVELKDDALLTIPLDVHDRTPKGNIRAITVQERHFRKSRTKAHKFLDARLHDLIFRILASIQPRYQDYCAVKEAFYTNKSMQTIIVHICGDSANFCINKYNRQLAEWREQHPDDKDGPSEELRASFGYHHQNTSWAMITPRGVTFHCFSSNPEYGCDKFRSSKRFAITGNRAAALFPQATGEEESSEAHGTVNYMRSTPFLHSFESTEAMRAFLNKLVRHVEVQNRTAKYCAAGDAVRSYDIEGYLRFFQDNQFKFCPPDKRCRRDLLSDKPGDSVDTTSPSAPSTPPNRFSHLKGVASGDTEEAEPTSAGEFFASTAAVVSKGSSLVRKCALSAYLKRTHRRTLRRTLRKKHRQRQLQQQHHQDEGIAV